jgi:hypothetical protein
MDGWTARVGISEGRPGTTTDPVHKVVHVSRVLFAADEPRTGGANMSVLVRLSVAGMTPDSYDKASEQLTPPLLAAAGFVAHVGFTEDGEFHVSEIWESRDEFQNWYDNNVEPNVPGVKVDGVTEVHNVIIKK